MNLDEFSLEFLFDLKDNFTTKFQYIFHICYNCFCFISSGYL